MESLVITLLKSPKMECIGTKTLAEPLLILVPLHAQLDSMLDTEVVCMSEMVKNYSCACGLLVLVYTLSLCSSQPATASSCHAKQASAHCSVLV